MNIKLKKNRYIGLRTSLIITNLCFSMIPTILIGIFSYNIFFKNIKENVYESLDMLFYMTNCRMNDYFDNIIALSETVFYNAVVQEDVIEYDKTSDLTVRSRLFSQLRSVLSGNESILSVGLYTLGGKEIVCGDLIYTPEMKEHIANVAKSKKGNGSLIFTVHQIGPKKEEIIFLTRFIKGVSAISEVGVGVIAIESNYINNIIKRDLGMPNTSFFLIDQDGKILSKYIVNKNLRDYEFDFKSMESMEYFETHSEKYLIRMNNISYAGWKIVALTDLNVITSKASTLKVGIIVMVVVVTFFLLLVLLIFNVSITKPIRQLVHAFETVGKGDLKYRIDLKCNNEFKMIGDEFNKMVAEIKTLTKRILSSQEQLYMIEIEKQQQQLHLLQSQINSHFLYNSLSTIRAMALNNETKQLVVVINSLVTMLRYSTKVSENATLQDELNYVDVYLKIQNTRYNNKFRLIVNVEDELRSCVVPHLFLQPFIENSIMHGFEEYLQDCIMQITASMEHNNLILCIEDNGKGLSDEQFDWLNEVLANWDKIDDTKPIKNIGLQNVQRRIKLLYGPNYNLKVERLTPGVRFVINLPYKTKQSKEMLMCIK